jgi:signal transduction histidine kinase
VYYFLEAANLAEASGRMNYLSVMYTNLGKVFYRLDQLEKSKKYYLMALEISRKNNDRHLLVQSLSGLGTLYKQMHELDTSLAYYNQAYQLVDTNIKNLQLGDIYANTGAIYHDKGNLDKALPYYQAAFKIYQDVDYPEGILALLNNIGQAYSSLNKYKEASIYLDSGLRLAIYYKFDTKRNKLLNSISENYYNWGDYKKAYEFLVRHKLLSDSIFNLDNSKMIHELETKYQKQQDQALILTLEKENLLKTIQKNAILYSAIALIMLALFLVLYLRQRMTKNKIIAEQKIRQLEEEKKFLSAKLLVEGQEEERKRIARELHDGLGVLLSATKMQFTSLKLSLPENKELFDRAVKLLEQASGDVRKISHNMMPGLLTKLGFYEAVEDLIDNVKDTPGLHAECIIEGDQSRLPENEEIMLYRVVQEMVNNTIKHARAKNITLQVTRAGKELQLIYKDDGVGFDAEKVLASPTASLGLKSIQSRIGFLNGDLRIDSAPGQGVRYTVTVPV